MGSKAQDAAERASGDFGTYQTKKGVYGVGNPPSRRFLGGFRRFDKDL